MFNPIRQRSFDQAHAQHLASSHRGLGVGGADGFLSTMIRFDDLPAGTAISHQYHDLGVDFTGALPVVATVPAGQARIGPRSPTSRPVTPASNSPSPMSPASSPAPTKQSRFMSAGLRDDGLNDIQVTL